MEMMEVMDQKSRSHKTFYTKRPEKNYSFTHTVDINCLKLIYNEHPKGIGEFIEILADTSVLDGLLEFLAGNFPILEAGLK